MASQTIGEAFGWLADQRPDAVAVRALRSDGATGETLTRGQLERISNRMARAWGAAGVGVDDVVAVALPNDVDVVLAHVAAWKAGATVMPLSPGLSALEREPVLDLADPALVVDDLAEVGGRAPGWDDTPLPPVAASSWKAPTSSGSTGVPKIVRATDPATVDPERGFAPWVPHHAVQLVAGPLWHAAPFVYALRGLMTGHELVVMSSFDPGVWLRAVAEHRVTWGLLVPAMMQRILEVEDHPSYDVSSLASVLHLGARCAPWLKRGWLDWLGPDRVLELYAGTESQGLTLVGGRDWLARPGTVGRPVGDTQLRVVRPDGSECATGEVGEVLMRRGRETYTYVGAEAQVRDGWHTLGDAGHLDAAGWLYLADRLADALEVDGRTVQPADVEAVLDAHPTVRAAVVVAREGRVHAVIEPAPGAEVDLDDLAVWSADRLEPHRQPASWQVVDEPLRDEAGKVRRARWRG